MSARTQAFIDLVRVGAIEPCLVDGRPGWRPADADPRALLIAVEACIDQLGARPSPVDDPPEYEPDEEAWAYE